MTIDALDIDAVLLDRDGVINARRERSVLHSQDWVWIPGSRDAVCDLAASFPVAIITNQAAIGRGDVQQSVVDLLHDRMRSDVRLSPERLRFYVCPHAPDNDCRCRKPMPELLLRAAHDFGVDIERTVFVGDQETDLGAAKSAGAAFVHVESGRDSCENWPDQCLCAPDLRTLTELLLRRTK